MKQLLGTLAVFLISITTFSQSKKLTVKGSVTDKLTHGALEGATVKLGTLVTMANDAGNFEFKQVLPGKYTLQISNIGYEDQQLTVDAADLKQPINIQLQSSPYFLQPLEIKALRAGDKAPFTKTNVGKEQIAKMNLGQDLPFLLNQTPSVVINSDAGNGVGYTGINIRGVDATRINVTLNGIPYNDAESQGTYYVDIPDFASGVSSIQIQRGVGTSSNGTGAFGASINLQTNEFNSKAYAELNNSFGSFNTWKNTIKAGTGLLNNHFSVDARLSRINSDGFIDRAASALQSYSVSAAYYGKSTSVRLNVFSGKEKTYQAWNGIPADVLAVNRTYNSAGTDKPGEPYSNETDNYTQTHYQLFINQQLSKKWSFNTAFYLVKGAGYYEQYKADAKFSSYGLPDLIVGTTTVTQTDLVRQLWLDNSFYGQIFSLHYKNAIDELTFGGGWSTYHGDHFGKIIWAKTGIDKDYRWYFNPALKKDANIYAKWQHKLNSHVDVFTDVQYKTVSHKMDGFRYNPDLMVNRSFNFLNPKLGITYHKNSWQAYASFAVGQKEPNRDDFEAGLTNQPKAEKLQNVEIGFENKTANYSYGANIYWMNYVNQLVLTGKINDVGAYTRTNVPNSYRLGIELQGAAIVKSWLHVGGTLTLSRNKIKAFTEYIDNWDDGTQLAVQHSNTNISFSPSKVASANITLLPCKKVEISFLSKYVGKQYLDNTQDNQRSLGDFYTQDIRLVYNFKTAVFKEINVIAQANNIFSRKYEPNGYTYAYINGGVLMADNYYFPQAGANFMIGLNVKF